MRNPRGSTRRAFLSASLAALAAAPLGGARAGDLEIRGAFRLVSQHGATMTEADLLGRPSAVFFGYTHCPDVCPTVLMEMAQVLAALGPKADGVRVVFVSVDPQRDTPALLRDFVAFFDPRIVALSGPQEEVDRALTTFHAYAEKIGSEDGYTFDHSAVVFLNDRTGRFVAPLRLSEGAEVAARQISALF